jgi:NAD(P)-dependent dehydrogenase (short-subunit alcohol dehydrogenase family)
MTQQLQDATTTTTPKFLQYPILPRSDLELPPLTKDTLFLAVGGRGIALAVALEFHRLGARVAVTTTDLETYDYTQLPDDGSIVVFHLDYTNVFATEAGSPHKFVDAYVKHFGRVWDMWHDGAMVVYEGFQAHYTVAELRDALDMYITGPTLLEQEFVKHMDPQRHYTVVYGLSSACLTAPPYVQALYVLRHQFVLNKIYGYEASQLYPNLRCRGVCCTFTSTQWFTNAINPSARAGDNAMIVYHEITAAMTPKIGVPTQTIATAVAQAALLSSSHMDDELIYMVPDLTGDKGRAGTAAMADMRNNETGKNYVEKYVAFCAHGFGLNIREH